MADETKKPHERTAEDICAELGVDVQHGLTDEQAASNRDRFGANQFTKGKKTTVLRRIWDSAREPMILMLIAAALITLIVNIVRSFTGGEADYWECVGIFAAISLSVAITVIMEGKSAKAFEALNNLNDDMLIKVIRNGEPQLLHKRELVVGDIINISTGDKLAADCRLISASSLMVDESALTGESMPVHKDANKVFDRHDVPVAERVNMLFSGCFVTSGNAEAVVTGVGDHTEFGKIAGALSAKQDGSTPLQEKIAKLGKRITILGVSAAAIVFIIQLIIFLVNNTASLDTVSEAFITSIVLIVAAVPEGLPTIVAVSLAIDVIKMSKQNALVKKMIACETIGCINVICSDKTGTLTQNRMTVTDIYTGGKLVNPQELADENLLNNFCINSTADVNFLENTNEFIGNPTECALLVAANKAGFEYKNVRDGAYIACVYPFSSELKNMTTVTGHNGQFTIYTKGSPEKILSLCDIAEDEKVKVEAQITAFEKNACRVIAFAHRQLSGQYNFEEERDKIENSFIFDGFVAITDPLREEVYAAATNCKTAGIELKMLTGDNIITATAIAKQLDLLDDEHIAVEAGYIEGLNDEQLKEQLPRIRVIARSTPIVKMRVVQALKAAGNVVAVTGDGINDAPALKKADVGIAMGISGTEVSKEASDIVLLDDSFATIEKSVRWGRGIYENFQRFIQFQLTVNLSSVIVVIISILAGFETPFTALQLLWINIIMDGPPALTLGLEPIREDLMARRPTKRNASIVSGGMLSRIIVNGVYISAVFMAQHWTNFLGGTTEQLPTILFTLFVVFQLFNAFNSRELGNTSIFRNILANKLMLCVVGVTFMLQVVITQFGGLFFGTVPLSLTTWLKIIGVAATVIVVSELVKLIKRLIANKLKSKS